jgi:hypothetical protein
VRATKTQGLVESPTLIGAVKVIEARSMTHSRNPRPRTALRQLASAAILTALAISGQLGCTREFFREWANMDVSEAVFEKTRDPRWRLDIFSVEPPMLSRYADPYDQDVPPAPPDDPAAEALSPMPQWPDNRLMMPVEGTGYLDLLEYWRRDQKRFLAAAAGVVLGGAPTFNLIPDEEQQPEYWQRPDNARHDVTAPRQPGMPGQPLTSPEGPPVPPETGSPFAAPPSLPPPGGRPGAGLPPGQPPATLTPSGPQAANGGRPRGALGESAGLVVRLQSADEDGDSPLPSRAKSPARERRPPNSGTSAQVSTPISLSPLATRGLRSKVPPPRSGLSFAKAAARQSRREQDRSIRKVSIPASEPAAQPPAGDGAAIRTQILQMVAPSVQPSAPPRPSASAGQPPTGAPGAGQERPVPATPSVILDREIAQEPPLITPDQVAAAGRMSPTEAAELSQVLVPPVIVQDDQEAYGYPKGSRVYKVNMQQAFLLALMNARFYQTNLETVYTAALPVTLQRFAFEPQFYAGMSPTTAVPQTNGASQAFGASFPATPGVITSNTFTYATRFSPTGQVSALNLGTIAGFGKLFSSGGQLLMGFANEVVFNFVGRNPAQPTVISALPISFVQPLLRGAGRAVVMEPLTQAERNLLYAVRSFALFRQQFFVVTLTGGQIQNFGQGFNLQGFSGAGNTDPTVGFLPVLFNLVQVEIDRRNLFFLESLARLYQELIQGEASGLARLQVDQVMQNLITARQRLFADKLAYRTSLDSFKMQMSLPPDIPLVLDMSLAQPFYDVFNAVDNWQRRSDRKLEQLPSIIAQIPELEDIDVEGRSVLGPYRNYRSTLKEFLPENEEGLEDLLQSAVRIAMEYRMDLMNTRAALYDAWRQIRFTANALRGVLNLAINNNIYTPVTSTNPLAFLSQAKQFSLSINAELPLVRVSERNNFRAALIKYQQARRALQTAEDNLKIQLRNDLRNVHQAYIFYEIAKRNFELNVRLKDQAFETIIAPPAAGVAGTQANNAAIQTTNLLNFQGQLVGAMLSLTNGWQNYQTQRLIVYRDIGILPYDEWEAFSELFPAQYHGPIIGHAPAGGAGFTPPAEAGAATVERR